MKGICRPFFIASAVFAGLGIVKNEPVLTKSIPSHKRLARLQSPMLIYKPHHDDAKSQENHDGNSQKEKDEHVPYYVTEPDEDDHQENNGNDTHHLHVSHRDYNYPHEQSHQTHYNDENDLKQLVASPETSKESKEDEQQKLLQDIKKNEDMSKLDAAAEELKRQGQTAAEDAKKIKAEAANWDKNEKSVDTSVEKVVPKHSGLFKCPIIIPRGNKHDEAQGKEPEDPLKAVRDATLNLFQRAQQKNLPVPEPGPLDTPQAIYQSLNLLEHIIDGYRNSQLESPNPNFNPPESDSNPPDPTLDLDAAPTEPRLLQIEPDDQEDQEGEEDEEHENDDEEEEPGEENSKEASQPPIKSKHEAMETLRSTIKELTSALNEVLVANTGVPNIMGIKDHDGL
ncbi:hypothetical protein BdWA1_000112 [Babesia duncani]|uniref:Uncharacterized protein n=1 Tax=Babesia duncani TaxID=323732 RepID=A0AAD9PMH5_9APIC|nr:hypothetical protein BdWA1_000112 [Babesia duncani]